MPTYPRQEPLLINRIWKAEPITLHYQTYQILSNADVKVPDYAGLFATFSNFSLIPEILTGVANSPNNSQCWAQVYSGSI
jgi:hypothetical protein